MKPFFSRNNHRWQVACAFVSLPLLLVALLSVLLAGCSSNKVVPVEQANSASCPEARAVIPIIYYDGGFIPVFQVQDTENGRSLNLGFDSGFSYNAMYSSMVDEEFKVESQSLVEEHIRSQHPELSPKKVERLAKQMIESGYIGANVSGLQVDSMEFATQEFRYEPVTAFKYQTIDGMVGLEFFGECRTVTIDGVPQTAIVDTGAEWFMKAGRKALSMSEEEKWDFVLNGRNVVKWTVGWKTVELGYGSTTEKVRTIAATNMFVRSSGMTTRVASVYNLFGWSVMKERAVQFDFENSRLILGERGGDKKK